MIIFDKYQSSFSESKEASATQYIPAVGGFVHGIQEPDRRQGKAVTSLMEGVPGFVGGSLMGILSDKLTGRMQLRTPIGRMLAAASLLIAASVGTAAGAKTGRFLIDERAKVPRKVDKITFGL